MTEAWAKCPTNGCRVMVWGSRAKPNHCSIHGGQSRFQEHTDEYGNPVSAERAGTLPRLAPAK